MPFLSAVALIAGGYAASASKEAREAAPTALRWPRPKAVYAAHWDYWMWPAGQVRFRCAGHTAAPGTFPHRQRCTRPFRQRCPSGRIRRNPRCIQRKRRRRRALSGRRRFAHPSQYPSVAGNCAFNTQAPCVPGREACASNGANRGTRSTRTREKP